MASSLSQRMLAYVAALVASVVLFACSAPLTGGADDLHTLAGGNLGDSVGGPKQTAPTALPGEDGFYPRAIQRADGSILASVVGHVSADQFGARFFESSDGGVSFREVGSIVDPANKAGLCCGTLFELPKPLGSMPAGTLLWAASQGADASAPMSIPVWKSDDGARHWSFLSKVAIGRVGRKSGGLWEPEFSMLDDGTLVCHWSDETDGGHSQKLVEARSSDGVQWRDQRDTVALPTFAHRPGMPNVRRAPGGPFILSYEICGLANDPCAAYLRTSKDGWSWGDAAWMGLRPSTPDGKHFRHAPTLAWSGAPGPNGRFFMVGQMVHAANGNVAKESGTVILANTDGADRGFWYPISAPVPVPDAYDNFCPNYSSTLLPLENGAVGLEIASRWDGKACRSYFARSPLIDTSDASEIKDGASYRLVSLVSGHCLDIAGGSADAGTAILQSTCSAAVSQRWKVVRGSDGAISLRSERSDLCVSVSGDSSESKADVQQAPCGQAGQTWKLRAVGVGYYELVKTGASVCLEVAGGSQKSGAKVSQWQCNDLSPQLWRIDAL